MKKGQKNVAKSGPNLKASKKSSASKTGKKRRVPLTDVSGSNENQENREANTTKNEQNKKERENPSSPGINWNFSR